MELAERIEAWKGFEVLVVTHTDKQYWHNHFIINSVNVEDGHKLQWKKSDLAEMKRINDELCWQHGLSIPEKGKTFDGKDRTEATTYSRAFYENFLKENAAGKDTDSYIFNIAVAVMQVRNVATSKGEFIKLLAEKNIGVSWEDNRQYITFIDLQREQDGQKKCKVRNKKLEQYFHVPFGKEELQNGFDENRNRERAENEELEKAGSREQPLKGGVDRVEREVREIAEEVKGLTGEKSRTGSPDERRDPKEHRAVPDKQRDLRARNRKRDRNPAL